MFVSPVNFRFGGVYTVETQGLGMLPKPGQAKSPKGKAQKSLPVQKFIHPHVLHGFYATQQSKLVKEAMSQLPQKTFFIHIPEKNAQHLQSHWEVDAKASAPSMQDYHHWLRNTMQTIGLWEAQQLQHHRKDETPTSIQARAKALVEEAQKLFHHWENQPGFRYLLFVDDAKGQDATRMRQTFYEQLNRLNNGEKVHVSPTLSVEGAKDKAGVNQRHLNYAWYQQTLLNANQRAKDSLSAPQLDGSFALKLRGLNLEANNHYTYRVHAYWNGPVSTLTSPVVLQGAVPAGALAILH